MPRCRSGFNRLLLVCLILLAVCTSVYRLWDQPPSFRPITLTTGSVSRHPIDHLIEDATETFNKLLSKQTTDLQEAASAYRERRGRHPPPAFDAWYTFAAAHNAILVEDMFDQIYDDLRPFWSVPAKQIRYQARHLPFKVIVRNGKVQNRKDEWQRLDHWINMVGKIEHLLPDLDIPMNVLDEPRVAVPWERISQYIAAEVESRTLFPADKVVQKFTDYNLDEETDATDGSASVFSANGRFWNKMRMGCAPDAPSHNLSAPTDFSEPPQFCSLGECASSDSFSSTYKGFVSNWTRAKDPCLQPELLDSHGLFIDPLSMSTTNSLIPIFAASKLSMNNEILLPSFSYWQPKSEYTTGISHGGPWDKKATAVMWRGIASGGRNTVNNWTRFHRHRFVALMNASSISTSSPTFALPAYQSRLAQNQSALDLASWIDVISNVGFTNLFCFDNSEGAECPHTNSHYRIEKEVDMRKQFRAKYLPDIDGNGFSGRYLAFLRSTSVPIKATLFSEWHDSRLVPWYHFVPMQNSFVDLYGILEYFVGRLGEAKRDGAVVMESGHDEQARRIAMQGKEWAEKVLRREDMLVYLLRLLLEYRRVCEEGRDTMGWVDDLVEEL